MFGLLPSHPIIFCLTILLPLLPVFFAMRHNEANIDIRRLFFCTTIASLSFTLWATLSSNLYLPYIGPILFIMAAAVLTDAQNWAFDYYTVLQEIWNILPNIHLQWPQTPTEIFRENEAHSKLTDNLAIAEKKIAQLKTDLERAISNYSSSLTEIKILKEERGEATEEQLYKFPRSSEPETPTLPKDQEIQLLRRQINTLEKKLHWRDYDKENDAKELERRTAYAENERYRLHTLLQQSNFQSAQAAHESQTLSTLCDLIKDFSDGPHGDPLQIAAVRVAYALWQKGFQPRTLGFDARRLEEMYKSVELGDRSPFRHEWGFGQRRDVGGPMPMLPETAWREEGGSGNGGQQRLAITAPPGGSGNGGERRLAIAAPPGRGNRGKRGFRW